MSKFNEKAGELLKNAAGAFEMFAGEKTDRIVKAVYRAGCDARYYVENHIIGGTYGL